MSLNRREKEEEWKDVAGYEGYYQISSMGRCRSLDRKVPHPVHGSMKVSGRVLSPRESGYGYYYVSLCRNSELTSKMLHKMVSEAFLPNLYDKPHVNHKDGDKLNNSVDNLEWCTQQENIRHAFDTGLNKVGLGKKHPMYKEGFVVSPFGQLFYFEGQNDFCRANGINFGGFSQMLRGLLTNTGGWHLPKCKSSGEKV